MVYNVDSGSNIHIVNNMLLCFEFVPEDGVLTQVGGSALRTKGRGKILVWFRHKVWILTNVLFISSNSQCTLSPGALKQNDVFPARHMTLDCC